MVRQERLQNGRLKISAVANFHARIVRDLVYDDGEQERREFAVEAVVGEIKLAFCVSAAEFQRMDWVLNKLGPRAIIYPGQHQHARAAIQCLSGEIGEERIFSHLGWRKPDGHWVYLHAGGALGAGGSVSNVRVQLPPSLLGYRMEALQELDERARAVRDSLHFLRVAPDRISVPLLAGVYAAALGKRGFSLFLVGRSGVFKSTIAALCQQHFGAAMDASRLPANFASTANALESLSFHAKDALLVTDDFAPTGMQSDGGLRSVAERLFRAAGNQQGRSRMGKDGRSSTSQPPRALVLATGEEVPRGESIRARLLIVELGPGEVDRVTLTECQKAAQQGRLAAAMGSFLVWVARQYDHLQQRLSARAQELRSEIDGRTLHARMPTAVADLQASLEIFFEFAFEIGAVGSAERANLAERSIVAFNDLMACQMKYHRTSDPALRFLSLLQAGLSCGRAHVCSRDGNAPPQASAWGWRCKRSGRAWVPRGERIGWLDGLDLYLEFSISYHLAQQMAGEERLPVSEQTLRHRLHERHLLASVDVGRQMLLVRRTIEGRPRQLLHLRASELRP
jgi:hypothetical protein